MLLFLHKPSYMFKDLIYLDETYMYMTEAHFENVYLKINIWSKSCHVNLTLHFWTTPASRHLLKCTITVNRNQFRNSLLQSLKLQATRGSAQETLAAESSGIGTFLGWGMAAIYLGGRLPQIYLNVIYRIWIFYYVISYLYLNGMFLFSTKILRTLLKIIGHFQNMI